MTLTTQVGNIPLMKKAKKDWRQLLIEAMEAHPKYRNNGRGKIDMKNLSIDAGVGDTFVRDILKRNRTPSFVLFQKVCRQLGKSVAELGGEEFVTEAGRIPLIDFVAAGKWTNVQPKERDFESEIAADKPVGPNAFALTVRGDSMLPIFPDGSTIIVDPDIAANPGDYVVAKLRDEDVATFKQYRDRGSDKKGRIVELKPLNENYASLIMDTNRPGEIIGPVVEFHTYPRR